MELLSILLKSIKQAGEVLLPIITVYLAWKLSRIETTVFQWQKEEKEAKDKKYIPSIKFVIAAYLLFEGPDGLYKSPWDTWFPMWVHNESSVFIMIAEYRYIKKGVKKSKSLKVIDKERESMQLPGFLKDTKDIFFPFPPNDNRVVWFDANVLLDSKTEEAYGISVIANSRKNNNDNLIKWKIPLDEIRDVIKNLKQIQKDALRGHYTS